MIGKKSTSALEVGDILKANKAFTNTNPPSATYASGEILGVCTKKEVGRVYYMLNGTERFVFDSVITLGTVKYYANNQFDYPLNTNPTFWEKAKQGVNENSGTITTIGSLLLGWFTGKSTATLDDGTGNQATLDSNGNLQTQSAEGKAAEKKAAEKEAAEKEALAAAQKKKTTNTVLIVVGIAVAIGGLVWYSMTKKKQKPAVAVATPVLSK